MPRLCSNALSLSLPFSRSKRAKFSHSFAGLLCCLRSLCCVHYCCARERVRFSMCALMLTMIYDNKNFIVVLALHASHTVVHCNSQTAYFLAVNFVVFPNEKPIALPLIQNSPSINYINCTLTARVFPMISQQSLSFPIFLFLAFAYTSLTHSPVQRLLARSFAHTLVRDRSQCVFVRTSHFGLFDTVCYCV